MAKITTITNPLTGQPAQVDQLDHTAQQIDDGLNIARGVSNPNILDNWYFANPVDQRGGYLVPKGTPLYEDTALTLSKGTVSEAYHVVDYVNSTYCAFPTNTPGIIWYVPTSYAVRGYTGAGYTIDRWKFLDSASDCVALITNNGVQVSIGSGNGHFCQEIETVIPEDAGITISALVNGELFTKSGVGGTEGGLIHGATFYYNKTYKRFGIWLPANSPTITIAGVKLELGDHQTLAHKDENGNWQLNEIPDYGDQLARCQRYFQLIPRLRIRNMPVTSIFPLIFPVKMRKSPTISIETPTDSFTIASDYANDHAVIMVNRTDDSTALNIAFSADL